VKIWIAFSFQGFAGKSASQTHNLRLHIGIGSLQGFGDVPAAQTKLWI